MLGVLADLREEVIAQAIAHFAVVLGSRLTLEEFKLFPTSRHEAL